MVWPGKRPTRVVAKAASVARTVAIPAATSASQSERTDTSITWLLLKAATYHFSENPPQADCDCDSLKEKITRMMIGR